MIIVEKLRESHFPTWTKLKLACRTGASAKSYQQCKFTFPYNDDMWDNKGDGRWVWGLIVITARKYELGGLSFSKCHCQASQLKSILLYNEGYRADRTSLCLLFSGMNSNPLSFPPHRVGAGEDQEPNPPQHFTSISDVIISSGSRPGFLVFQDKTSWKKDWT